MVKLAVLKDNVLSDERLKPYQVLENMRCWKVVEPPLAILFCHIACEYVELRFSTFFPIFRHRRRTNIKITVDIVIK